MKGVTYRATVSFGIQNKVQPTKIIKMRQQSAKKTVGAADGREKEKNEGRQDKFMCECALECACASGAW